MRIAELRRRFPLKILLKISCLPRSTFYYHVKAGKTDRDSADKQSIMEVFEKNGQRYGYRRIACALQEKGIKINHKKVQRLMKMLIKYLIWKGEVTSSN